MTRWSRLALLVALIGALLSNVNGLAQETPVPDPESESESESASVLLLPDATAFGPGWTRVSVQSMDAISWAMTITPDVFREGAVAVYGGPNGARVILATLLLTEDRVAIRRGWEHATQLFNNYGYQLTYDYAAAAAWDALPPPNGCAEARRMEGTAREFGYLTGITLCAADPDLIVVAVASGLVNDRSGHEGSDAVVNAVIALRG